MQFATKALHVNSADKFGAMRFPIYQNAAFEAFNSQNLENIFSGAEAGHVYSRSSNPTLNDFENRIKNISGAHGVLSMASGMAAVSNVLFALLQTGDNFLASRHLFGNTISLFDTLFRDLGIEVRYFEGIEDLKTLIDDKTRLLFCESLSNPGLRLLDLKPIKSLLNLYDVPLVVDTTLTPWNIFDAKLNGVDIEIISATKWLSGGGSAVGGLVLDYGTFDFSKIKSLDKYSAKYKKDAFLAKLRKETYRNLGASISPQSAYLLSLGLETLDLRVERSCNSAYILSKQLEKRGLKIHYPLLESSPYFGLAREILPKGGAILGLDLGTKEIAYNFMDKLKILKRGTNILDNKSLVIAPYHTIYGEFTQAQKALWGIGEGFMRISIGLEAVEDLEADILEAL